MCCSPMHCQPILRAFALPSFFPCHIQQHVCTFLLGAMSITMPPETLICTSIQQNGSIMSIIYVTSLFCQTPTSHKPYLTALVIVPMENYLLSPNISKYCILMALKNNVKVEHLRLKCTKTLSNERRNTQSIPSLT